MTNQQIPFSYYLKGLAFRSVDRLFDDETTKLSSETVRYNFLKMFSEDKNQLFRIRNVKGAKNPNRYSLYGYIKEFLPEWFTDVFLYSYSVQFKRLDLGHVAVYRYSTWSIVKYDPAPFKTIFPFGVPVTEAQFNKWFNYTLWKAHQFYFDKYTTQATADKMVVDFTAALFSCGLEFTQSDVRQLFDKFLKSKDLPTLVTVNGSKYAISSDNGKLLIKKAF